MKRLVRLGAIAAIAAVLPSVATAQVIALTPSPMDGAQAATSSTGTGRVNCVLDLSTNVLSWHITWQGLTGAATVAHFHGPALPGQNGGVQIGLGTTSPETGSAVLSASQRNDLLAGLWYVNIHTGAFPGGEIRGQVNPAAVSVVLNEVFYDGVGADDGQTFVELAAPAGTDLTDWQVVSVEGGSASSCGAVNTNGTITLAGAAQADGLFVIGDLDSGGATAVACPPGHNGGAPDMLVSNCDFENGTDAVQLKHPTGLVVDAVTYGAGACAVIDVNGDPIVEGTAAEDAFGGYSLERWPQGKDTNDNSVDFTPQCDPSPGGSTEPRALFFNGSPTISGATGGQIDLTVHTARPGSQYIVFAFFTQPTSKQTLGLPFDPVTNLFLTLATTPNPVVVNFVGVLGGTGAATANLIVPAGTPIAAPVSLYFAGATVPINPNSIATNPVQVTFNP